MVKRSRWRASDWPLHFLHRKCLKYFCFLYLLIGIVPENVQSQLQYINQPQTYEVEGGGLPQVIRVGALIFAFYFYLLCMLCKTCFLNVVKTKNFRWIVWWRRLHWWNCIQACCRKVYIYNPFFVYTDKANKNHGLPFKSKRVNADPTILPRSRLSTQLERLNPGDSCHAPHPTTLSMVWNTQCLCIHELAKTKS